MKKIQYYVLLLLQPESDRHRRKRRTEEDNNDTYEVISKKKRYYSKSDPTYKSLNETPRKTMLRKTMMKERTYYKRKITALNVKCRRPEQRVTRLSDMLKTLQQKDLISSEHAAILKSMGECNVQLFKRFFLHTSHKNNNKQKHTKNSITTANNTEKTEPKKLAKKYPPLIRQFALTLYYYSPKAYKYVRSQFNLCLPHPNAIGK